MNIAVLTLLFAQALARPQAQAEDDTLVPGVGLRGVVVGKSTLEDALRVFGEDGQVTRFSSGAAITYLTMPEGTSQGGRAASRPTQLVFVGDKLAMLSVLQDRADLHTPRGNHVGSTRAEVVAEFGEGDDPGDLRGLAHVPTVPANVEALGYSEPGIIFVIDRATNKVAGISITEAYASQRARLVLEPGQLKPEPIAPSPENTLVPGAGIAGLEIGKSTIEDALRVFGETELHGAKHGWAFLSYRQDDARPARPQTLHFEDGVLVAVTALPMNPLVTPAGHRVGSPVEVLRAELGDDYEVRTSTIERAGAPPLVVDTTTYWRRGVRWHADRSTGVAFEMTIFKKSPGPRPAPPSPADLIWTAGQGIHGLVLGVSTPEDVIAFYGVHARVHRNDKTGQVTLIHCGFDPKQFEGGEGFDARPDAFGFRRGALSMIRIGPANTQLKSADGLGIGSTRAELEKVYGPAIETPLKPEEEKERREGEAARASWAARGGEEAKATLAGEHFSTELSYPALGMTLRVNSDTQQITSIVLRPREP